MLREAVILTHLPAFFTKPESAKPSLQISQRKQSGCQLACMALMTRPMTNLPVKCVKKAPNEQVIILNQLGFLSGL